VWPNSPCDCAHKVTLLTSFLVMFSYSQFIGSKHVGLTDNRKCVFGGRGIPKSLRQLRLFFFLVY
jgi:hypothetical protein